MFTAIEAKEYLEQLNSYGYFLEKILEKVKSNISALKSNQTTFSIDSRYIHFKDQAEIDLKKLGYNVEYVEKDVMRNDKYAGKLKYFRISF